jgi:hypothetical protein
MFAFSSGLTLTQTAGSIQRLSLLKQPLLSVVNDHLISLPNIQQLKLLGIWFSWMSLMIQKIPVSFSDALHTRG